MENMGTMDGKSDAQEQFWKFRGSWDSLNAVLMIIMYDGQVGDKIKCPIEQWLGHYSMVENNRAQVQP